ncbi:MAG: class I SAM-dependent rRNA methyltransferase [Candidatus Eisenbacteria bacterium]|nr:class I SAM-dependent rRNA methyltransferase [Candidatus Eisenbacteria bacterium]
MPQLPRVFLKKNEDRRQRIGHPWIFSNEIEKSEGTIEDGGLVDVYSHGRTFLGRGHINRQSLISIRILTREPEEIDKAFFRERMRRAIEYRQTFAAGRDALRLVFSEGDFLPGLVVDSYLDCVAMQITTLGMERQTEILLDVIEELLNPAAIVLRNDTSARIQEGLPQEKTVARGSCSAPLLLKDMSLLTIVDLLNSQKTGLYLDQSENRSVLEDVVLGKRVMDCFCYGGAWGVDAARLGAVESVLVDASPRALEMAKQCAFLNGVPERCSFVQENCFSYLRKLHFAGERFDVVVLDPPGLVKSRGKLRAGVELYERLNTAAMKLVNPGGVLVTCSCSHNVDREMFLSLLARAASQARREVQIVEIRSQSKDHPMQLPGRVSEYLKCVTLKVW